MIGGPSATYAAPTSRGPRSAGSLVAVSDLHVGHAENRGLVQQLHPAHPADWLIVAGDVGDLIEDITWALTLLAERFERVIWVPGNHELLAQRDDPAELRGVARYNHLVGLCRSLGIDTPEDPYPVWHGPTGDVTIAPLFVLYDYSYGRNVGPTPEAAMARAHEAGVVCVDEFLLDPAPHAARADWCAARVAYSEARLEACDPSLPTILVNHFPLTEEPTKILFHPEFAQWCGTLKTADWHTRFRAQAVIYGHLHIKRTIWTDGVRFEEVSLGYPREWKRRGSLNAARPVRVLDGPQVLA